MVSMCIECGRAQTPAEQMDGGCVTCARIEELKRERDEMRDNLRKYGEHQPPCPRYSMDASGQACSCGFDAAIETPIGVGSEYDPSPPPGITGEVKP